MERDLDDIINECKEFINLKSKHKVARFPDAGTPAYIISKEWIKKYKQFILYKDIKSNSKPHIKDDHCKDNHPGEISNQEDLIDQSHILMKGTNSLQKFDFTCYDRYIKKDHRERFHYKIYNEELWKFLYERYGGTTIKRYYIKQGQFYSQVEISLKRVKFTYMGNTQIKSNIPINEILLSNIVQMSKRHNYSDLKIRIADVLTNLYGKEIGKEQLHLWKLTENPEVLSQKIEQIRQNEDMQEEQKDDQMEFNSGIEFPGESLEPIVNLPTNLDDDSLDEGYLVVEFIENPNDQFQFKYVKNQRVHIGKCEFCGQKKILKIECECKRVKYCNQNCLQKDKMYHVPHCSAKADVDLQVNGGFSRKANAKDGKVGLYNLGNTCYMNSSLQCLSNTWELTYYFLCQNFLSDLNKNNVLGSEGRLAQAYGKLVNEMWNEDDNVVKPSMFKRILGQYAQQFQGFGQHDSQECINSILDLLSEDLFRKDKKPYVELTEADGKPDAEASNEAWQKHLQRNDSIIVDLFHGQYKSTLVCSICKRISITFDPFLTMSLPIPGKKEKIKLFYIPYDMNPDDANNYSVQYSFRESDTMDTFREEIESALGIKRNDYIISNVCNSQFKKIFNMSSKIEDFKSDGLILLYQIDPTLNPSLLPKDQINKFDSNYGVSDQYNKQPIHIMKFFRPNYSNYTLTKNACIPRMMWVNKQWTLKQLHLKVFEFFQKMFINWYKLSQTEENERDFEDCKPLFKNNSIDEKEQNILNLEEFLNLSIEERFSIVFPQLNEENWKEQLNKEGMNYTEMPYILRLKNISGYMDPCCYCNDKRCEGCPLPFTSNMTYQDLLNKVGINFNVSFYHERYQENGRSDIIFEMIWSQDIPQTLFASMQSASTHPVQKMELNDTEKEESKDGALTLQDCLEEFKKSEVLDEENKWYCSKCKQHVQATKQLEIFKLPPVLVISLKRFKISKRYWGGGSKLNTFVQFPVNSLDMSKHCLYDDGKPLIYDCYAVSNHYGNMGFGHYTAYSQNWKDQQWYAYDDSNCSKTGKQRIVSEGAYNLFYRRRGYLDLANLDYQFIRLTQRQ